MPRIIVREYDNTTSPISEYSNYAVVVPGILGTPAKADATVFDDNDVALLTNQTDFINYVGVNDTKVKVEVEEKIGETTVTKAIYNIGNQIAYALLGLGFPVYYMRITEADAKNIATPAFWNVLKDKSLYEFRYLLSGCIDGETNAVNNAMLGVASYDNTSEDISNPSTISSTGRGDCVALCDVPSKLYSKDVAPGGLDARLKALMVAANGITGDKYTAIFAPQITYGSVSGSYTNKEFPASFHYLTCVANASQSFAEWYAVSGYRRGVSNYSISNVDIKLGDAAINNLQGRVPVKIDGDTSLTKSVNVIAVQNGAYYLWGNRTAEALDTTGLRASHFLNIRQLCTTLKKQLYYACRSLMFDPNSDVLWTNFENSITPTLDRMKADQGIRDYKIMQVKDGTKALLKAKIRIVPIEAVEDFDISLYLEDSISGADVTVTEA